MSVHDLQVGLFSSQDHTQTICAKAKLGKACVPDVDVPCGDNIPDSVERSGLLGPMSQHLGILGNYP